MNFIKNTNSTISLALFSKNMLLIALFLLSISVQGQKIVIPEGDVSICAGSKINLNAKFSIGTFVYFHSANGKAYFLDTVARSWTAARTAATNNGMQLWVIDHIGENASVQNKITTKNQDSFFWIGLFQDPSIETSGGGGPADGWKWVNGTPLDPALTYWAGNIKEPDNQFQTITPANFGSMGFNGTQSVWSDMPDNPPAPYYGYAIAEMAIPSAPTFVWKSQVGLSTPITTNTSVPVITVQPSLTTTYSVSLNIGKGVIQSSPITVTVNQPLSTAPFTIAPDSISCLVQNKFNFILDQSGIADPLTTTYSWDFKDGKKSSQGSNLSHQYSSPGSYAVSLTVRDKNGCPSTYTMPSPLVVRDAPLPTILSAPQKNICQGQTATITIPNPQAGVAYTWTDINSNVLGLGTTIVASTTGKFILEAVLISSGCKDTVSTDLLVNPLPITPTLTAASAIICQSDSLLLSTIPTAETLLGYTWFSGVNPDSLGNTLLRTYFAKSPSGMGVTPTTIDFYVRTTDKNKCNSLLSTPYSVTFNPSPNVQISSNGMPTTFCVGNKVNIEITAAMLGSLNYFWSFDNVPIPSLDNATNNDFNTNGIVRVRAVNSTYNCGSTSNPINIVVNDYPPIPTIIPEATVPETTSTGFNICPGTTSKLSTSPLLGASYQWYINDTIIPSAQSQSVTINRAGIYTVETSLNGCASASTKTMVGLLPRPQGIFIPPVIKTICNGSTSSLNASNSFGYQWYLNYKPIDSATSSSFNAASSGVYQVEFFTDKGCKSMSDSLVILSVLKKPTPAFTYDLFCVNVPSIFTNQSISTNSGPVTYLWEFQNGEKKDSVNVMHVFPTSGVYKVILNVIPTLCPQLVDSISANILVESPLNGIRYPPVEARVGKPISLIARSFGVSFEWVPSTGLDNPAIRIPLLTPTTEQLYTIKILNRAGCLNVDSVLVRIFDEQDIFIAGAFTPNNDGKNDKIYPFLVSVSSFHYLKIFNRWGNLVFQTTSVDPELGWDGKYKGRDQPADTYTWIVEAVGENGKVFRKSGSLILIR